MNDYKDLIGRLKCPNDVSKCKFWGRYHNNCVECENHALKDAAMAIETLLAERNVLLDALRGSCGDCVFRETKKCEEPCIGCYHAPQHFCEPPSADSGLSECWQWRGTGGSDGS